MTPRPGRLREVITVDIPRPRTLDAIGTPRFAELKHQILELIVEHENRGIAQAVAAP
jgi:NitT/TauT family transport system ATP-binding protein